MKKYFFLMLIIALLICFSEAAFAQFPFWLGPPSPFYYPLSLSLINPLVPYLSPFSAPFPVGPFPSSVLPPRTSLSLLSPVRMPTPLLRQAATTATVTIYFNPALSVIQVTVLPLTPLAPAPVPAPVTAVAPAIAPAVGLTALALLPLLTGLTGPTQTKTLTRLTTTTPAIPALTGITGLLPLI
jgi:hypothetical protein